MTRLVGTNSASEIKNVTRDAFRSYDDAGATEGPQASLSKLCSLKGIGPASASLLLSVYEMDRIPFFSDECFRWVMYADDKKGHGWDREIKYDAKSYNAYFERVQELRDRLKEGDETVQACDVERVGFVLGKEAAAGGNKRRGEAKQEKSEARQEKEERSSRKRAGDEDGDAQDGDPIASRTRRSKKLHDA